MAGGGADRLRPHAGPVGAGKRRCLRPSAVHHAGGLADDRAGQRRRACLRPGDAGAERGVLPDDAGPRGGLDRGDADFGPRGDGEPRPDDAVGRDRGGSAGGRVPAGLRRAGDRHAGAGACDVAPVSAGGGVRNNDIKDTHSAKSPAKARRQEYIPTLHQRKLSCRIGDLADNTCKDSTIPIASSCITNNAALS